MPDNMEKSSRQRDVLLNAYIERLFSNETREEPIDSVAVGETEMELPDWYDERKFKQGQRFFWRNCFALVVSMILGLIGVMAIPSILTVLIRSRHSTSPLTAYRRYFSTLKHLLYWFSYDLKPGTLCWKSLYTVRKRHYQAGAARKLKGYGIVSQRDVLLTLQGFFGYSYLKPDAFAINQVEEGDWEAYNHFWAVIVHMLGLQDSINMCRFSFHETRELCQIIQDRVFTPCLENPPEYFEHMTRVMLEGVSVIYPPLEVTSVLYWTKKLTDVPGYIYTETERMDLEKKLKTIVGEDKGATGVESSSLIEASAVEGLPFTKPRILYPLDFMSVETSPEYKQLPFIGKYKLAVMQIIFCSYSTYIGRAVFNFYFKYLMFLAYYLPFLATWKFGLKYGFVDAFQEDISDNAIPKENSEYYKPHPAESWYEKLLAILW